MVQVSGGQLITSTGQPIMVQAVPGGQGQTIMQVPVSGTQGLQQVRVFLKYLDCTSVKSGMTMGGVCICMCAGLLYEWGPGVSVTCLHISLASFQHF